MSEKNNQTKIISGTPPQNKTKIANFFFLQFTFLVYSLCGILSKMASAVAFLSPQFILFYGGIIGILMVYALLWQQILKRFTLNFAYVNKSVIVIWGMIWGVLFFQETITPLMLLGSVIVLIGITLAAKTYE